MISLFASFASSVGVGVLCREFFICGRTDSDINYFSCYDVFCTVAYISNVIYVACISTLYDVSDFDDVDFSPFYS